MASAVHFILEVGLTAADTADITNIPINKAAYQATFPSDSDWTALLGTMADTVDADTTLIASLVTDIANVQNAVVVLGENMGAGEDLTEEFNEFLTELLGSSDPDDLTGTLISAYLSEHLLGYEL
jgi:hypothetical protein